MAEIGLNKRSSKPESSSSKFELNTSSGGQQRSSYDSLAKSKSPITPKSTPSGGSPAPPSSPAPAPPRNQYFPLSLSPLPFCLPPFPFPPQPSPFPFSLFPPFHSLPPFLLPFPLLFYFLFPLSSLLFLLSFLPSPFPHPWVLFSLPLWLPGRKQYTAPSSPPFHPFSFPPSSLSLSSFHSQIFIPSLSLFNPPLTNTGKWGNGKQ